MCERETERDRERDRERQRQKQREKQRETETEREQRGERGGGSSYLRRWMQIKSARFLVDKVSAVLEEQTERRQRLQRSVDGKENSLAGWRRHNRLRKEGPHQVEMRHPTQITLIVVHSEGLNEGAIREGKENRQRA